MDTTSKPLIEATYTITDAKTLAVTKVIPEKTEVQTYDYDFLIAQRDRITADRDQRILELEEVNNLLSNFPVVTPPKELPVEEIIL